MTKIIGLLGITIAIAITAHGSARAQLGNPCQSSGAPVNPNIPGARDVEFSDMPGQVQKGMAEHQAVLGIEMGRAQWPDCYGDLESWACAGDGWWCTCSPVGDDYVCGCETGSC